jgi:hypothetical protein
MGVTNLLQQLSQQVSPCLLSRRNSQSGHNLDIAQRGQQQATGTRVKKHTQPNLHQTDWKRVKRLLRYTAEPQPHSTM